jgi:16S rRNA (uracil1498-N3)-methyltransferase
VNRFYVEPAASNGTAIELSERESHHAINVLRLKENDRVSVLNGIGTEFLCHVGKISKHAVELRVYQRNSLPPLPYQLTLVQALPKGKTMETIIQKAAELGVSTIVPILAERTVSHLDQENTETRLEKWNWIAIDAIKQCGSGWLPRIERPRKTSDYLASSERFDLNFLASLQPDARHPRVCFRDFLQEKKRKPKTLSVWIGPEGDFTPAEINAIRAGGTLPITLGQLILRSETAAFYSLSILNYELQAPE